MLGDTHDYAAMATPTTSAPVANARVRPDRMFCGGIVVSTAGEKIGDLDEHMRGSTLLLEKLAEQAFGGLLVASALDENIENKAILVDGTPQPMLLPGDADNNLASRAGDLTPTRSQNRLRAAYMPDVARAVFRTAPEPIPGARRPPGFDIAYGISTLHQRFACARLSGSHLTGLLPAFGCNAHYDRS
jgi:hypothetical protein